MTRPRIVDPGATLAFSRRTTRHHFLLHPDGARQMEQVYWYCLAYAAKLHGVLVHAACLMSTHAHQVVTDVRGEYPKFLETFHRNLAVCTRAYRGWPEELELWLEMPVVLQLVYGSELARERIRERVRDKQYQAWKKAKRSGRPFLGSKRVLRLAHTKRAKSYEVFGSLNPQFAAAGHRRAATEAATRVQSAIRAGARGVDQRRPERVLPEGHLVDAGVSRGPVWARAVAPRQSLNLCLRLRDASGGAEVQPQNDRGSADALHNTSFVQSALALSARVPKPSDAGGGAIGATRARTTRPSHFRSRRRLQQ